MRWLLVAALMALQTGPSIVVDPASGPPGSTFVVSGSGFDAGEHIRVTWDGSNLGGIIRADDGGTFRYAGVVPAGAPAGSHVIEARGRTSGGASSGFAVALPATTSSTNTPATTTPPTTVATTAPPATASPATTSPATTAPPAGAPTTTEAPTPTSVGPGDRAGVSRPEVRPTATSIPEPTAVDSRPAGGPGFGILEALGILAGLGALSAWFRWGRKPADGTPQLSVGPATLEPMVVEPPPVGATDAGWVRRALQTDAQVFGCSAVPGGALAYGRSSGSLATVWRSSDGLAWSPMAVLDPGRVTAVVPTRDAVYALGEREVDGEHVAACWWTGDGKSWVPRTPTEDLSLMGVVFEGAVLTDGTLVAQGRATGGPGVWTSRDGATWSRVGMLDGVDLLAEAGGTVYAFGHRALERDAIAARSEDGVLWEPLGEALFALSAAALSSIVSFDGGVVAAGIDKMTGAAAVWVSDDGDRWLRAPFEPRSGTTIDRLVSTDRGLIAVGSDVGVRRTRRPPSIAVWDSEDAVTWHRRDESVLLQDSAPAGAAVIGDHLVVVGALLPGLESPWPERTAATWRHRIDAERMVKGDVGAFVGG